MRGTQFAQLTAFVAVAEHRSFTKAAAHLGIKAPSLSQAIRDLEDNFGVRLLNRTTRSVALTEAGQQLLGNLSPALAGVDEAIEAVTEFRDNPAGTLRLTVHPIAAVTLIGPLVARFSAEYQDIRLDISVDAKRKDIVSERFDAGIHLGDSIAQDMIAVPIGGRIRLSTVASRDYLARHEAPLVPGNLQQHNCICYRGDTGQVARSWRFQKAGQQEEVAVDGSLSVNDLQFALRAGLDGVGIVQLPEAWVAPLVSDRQLVPVLEDWSPRWTDFCLFYSSRRHVPAKLRALVDFLRRESKQSVQPQRGRIQLTATKVQAISVVVEPSAMPKPYGRVQPARALASAG
jgi:DNA-binding transcriptional LysR family regulator